MACYTSLLFVCVIMLCSSGSLQDRTFHASITFRDRRLLSGIIISVKTSTLIQCVRLCTLYPECKSFNLGPGRTCELLDTFYCESPYAILEQDGYVYFDVDEDVADGAIQEVLSSAACTRDHRCSVKCASLTQNIGRLCDNDSDCNPEAECRDGLCLCPIGFAYERTTDSCVSDCDTYGNSFSYKTNWSLAGFNDFIYEDVEALSLCLEYCQKIDTCRSVEYSQTDRLCYGSLSTCHDQPSMCGRNPYFTHYTRNCA